MWCDDMTLTWLYCAKSVMIQSLGPNDRLRTWTMLDSWNLETIECKQVYSSLLIREAKLLPETSGANIVPLCNASINVTMVYIVLKQTLGLQNPHDFHCIFLILAERTVLTVLLGLFFSTLFFQQSMQSFQWILDFRWMISYRRTKATIQQQTIEKKNIGLAKKTRSCSSRIFWSIRLAYNCNHYILFVHLRILYSNSYSFLRPEKKEIILISLLRWTAGDGTVGFFSSICERAFSNNSTSPCSCHHHSSLPLDSRLVPWDANLCIRSHNTNLNFAGATLELPDILKTNSNSMSNLYVVTLRANFLNLKTATLWKIHRFEWIPWGSFVGFPSILPWCSYHHWSKFATRSLLLVVSLEPWWNRSCSHKMFED